MHEILVMLENFSSDHILLWLIVLFFWMLISNIIPITFIIYPDIFVFLWIFIAAKLLPWRIPWIILIIWAFIWETISYFIWLKYWKKILKHKFFKNKKTNIRISKLKKNQTKTFIVWKLIPWIVRFIPFFAWIIKFDFNKFLILDFLMIIYWISYLFIVRLVWIKIAINFLWDIVRIILPIIIIIYLIVEYHRNKKIDIE